MARRSALATVLVVALATVALRSLFTPAEVFVVGSPTTLRGSAQSSFTGLPVNVESSELVAMKALPEPRPNDNMLPVDLNRTSLYWGLLTILILAILFSSFLFNERLKVLMAFVRPDSG
eukprot:CAMPEP_0178403886 /NCGR_PEP_ID=MMETSP0689_2-20121128/17599_1 /TAXON_ID=160604 /ORGANISM="Amphidinium massartii, Strain CS-259" /LENGTH=118 /DNA_ID=CAMNT_0020024853 /DNA_START=86 /DNA_END=440 /DNA_ORIENTATION=-